MQPGGPQGRNGTRPRRPLPSQFERHDLEAGPLASFLERRLELVVDVLPIALDPAGRDVVREDAVLEQAAALRIGPEPAISVEVVLLRVDLRRNAGLGPPRVHLA